MATTTIAEFSVARTWESDRRSPLRWVLSHALQHKVFIIGVFIGAFGNGIGAGLVAIFIGLGFTAIVDDGDVTRLGNRDRGFRPRLGDRWCGCAVLSALSVTYARDLLDSSLYSLPAHLF